jgi:cholesterol transport system auxiliary component
MRVWVLLLLAGCSVLAKSKPLDVRYFSPEIEPATALVAYRGDQPDTGAARARVRLGRITASAHLRERIAYRETAVQLHLYDARWWTEDPDAYVRRSLARALDEHPALEQAIGGPVPTLDVEVLAFEELRAGGRPAAARVRLSYRLRDDRAVLASGTVTVDQPVRSGDFESVVATIAVAMDDATKRIADVVWRTVGERALRTTRR